MLEGIMPLIWWGISALALLVLILLIITIMLFRRMKHFESTYITLQTFMTGNQLENLFQECLQRLAKQEGQLEKCTNRLTSVEQKLRASVDRVELTRFKAFENVGSDLSFALAFLNQEGSGVVMSAIHNREESRVYAKPVNEGASSYLLTEEEKEVITKAMNGQKI